MLHGPVACVGQGIAKPSSLDPHHCALVSSVVPRVTVSALKNVLCGALVGTSAAVRESLDPTVSVEMRRLNNMGGVKQRAVSRSARQIE
jgi:hypothetical protein